MPNGGSFLGCMCDGEPKVCMSVKCLCWTLPDPLDCPIPSLHGAAPSFAAQDAPGTGIVLFGSAFSACFPGQGDRQAGCAASSGAALISIFMAHQSLCALLSPQRLSQLQQLAGLESALGEDGLGRNSGLFIAKLFRTFNRQKCIGIVEHNRLGI